MQCFVGGKGFARTFCQDEKTCATCNKENLGCSEEKHFYPFVEFFFGILRSVAEFLRFREVNWDVSVNRLRIYGGARPCRDLKTMIVD